MTAEHPAQLGCRSVGGRHDATGTLLDTIVRLPRPEFFVSNEGGMTVTRLPFGRNPVAAVDGGVFIFGTGDSFEFRMFSVDGSLMGIVRKDAGRTTVTEEDLNALFRERTEDVSNENWHRRMQHMFATMPIPEVFPAYDQILVDSERNVWVREYKRPGPNAETQVWSVFAPQGGLLAELTIPSAIDILEIGSDYVLGRWTDALDVEHVRLYRLDKRVVGR